jgi:hypothetical protein
MEGENQTEVAPEATPVEEPKVEETQTEQPAV